MLIVVVVAIGVCFAFAFAFAFAGPKTVRANRVAQSGRGSAVEKSE